MSILTPEQHLAGVLIIRHSVLVYQAGVIHEASRKAKYFGENIKLKGMSDKHYGH